MREALVRIEIQTQVKPRAAPDDVTEIVLEFTALKCRYCIPCQLLEFGVSLIPHIKARELVIPRLVGKASHGATVDFFLLRAQPVLIEKHGETFVEAGIVGVALDLAAQHG